MARKQVLFLIVEGKHDHIILRDPLTVLLKEAYEKQLVVIPIESSDGLLSSRPNRQGGDVTGTLEHMLQSKMDQIRTRLSDNPHS